MAKEEALKEDEDQQLTLCMQSQKFIQFTSADVGLIISKLYEDEAVFSFGWRWDGGFSYFIINDYIHGVEDAPRPLESAEDLKHLPYHLVDFFYDHYGSADFWYKMENAFSIIAYSYAVLYPESYFVQFYNERHGYSDQLPETNY